ncbi:hypothetical protein [Mycoplasmopsis lipofaciens]|uniref:hypothetical protein n=1 Tax=Mycoplasmopsis lipofaciens TaxID=114884 RepID=UPI0004861C7E|nr:hypothetical protein [Mycoplasmopsis lipofaciens]
MKWNNKKFKKLLLKYFKFLNNFKSISVYMNENVNKIKPRLRIIFPKNFIFHSLGIQYCTKLRYRYKNKIEDFVKDLINDQINFDEIFKNIKKPNINKFLKKLLALKIFLEITDNHNAKYNNVFSGFDFFKIKPSFDINGTYNHSQLLLASKLDKNNKRCVIYGILNNLYGLNNKNDFFYNENKQIINSVFVPISLKYQNDKSINKMNSMKISYCFLNNKNGVQPHY